MRLFFAVRLPEKVSQRVHQELVSEVPTVGFSRSKGDKLHITLFFLGETPEKKVFELKKAAEHIGKENMPFEVELSDIGHFGGRVVWLGIENGQKELSELNQNLCKALKVKNDSVFHPHVSLAKNKTGSKAQLGLLIQKLKEKKFAEKFLVNEFELVKSDLSESGAKYSTVFSVKLRL